MKIGINVRFLLHPYTGIGQYTHCLVEALAAVDTKNEYFLFTPELVEWNLPDRFHQLRLKETGSVSPSISKAHWEHTLLPEECQKWKVDLAHFLYPSNPWGRLPFPAVVTVHDVIPWRLPAYRRRLRSKLIHWYVHQALKKADHLITPSQFSKHEILELFNIKEKNISVIPHGLPSYSPSLALPPLALRRDFILYVGGYDERKNIPSLIRAYLKHIANDFTVDLILVGGKLKGLEALITDQYASRVTSDIPVQPKGQLIFTEPLSNNDLGALYRQARFFVHPSLYEGFNLPLAEAMNAGLPIAASDIPVNHEVAGGAAMFFDPHSVDSIGTTIKTLLKDSFKQRNLAINARDRASLYNWKKSAEETLHVYNLFV